MGAVEDLRERLGEVHDLSRAASLLAWDERTMMPSAGAETRAPKLATLDRRRAAPADRPPGGRGAAPPDARDARPRPPRAVLRGRDRAADRPGSIRAGK